ncbi:TPA_asm: hypothetical protein [Triaenorhabdovirus 2]|nr:TPA_asm: hypothetical protein [Triaenorhabdovirus 2]
MSDSMESITDQLDQFKTTIDEGKLHVDDSQLDFSINEAEPEVRTRRRVTTKGSQMKENKKPLNISNISKRRFEGGVSCSNPKRSSVLNSSSQSSNVRQCIPVSIKNYLEKTETGEQKVQETVFEVPNVPQGKHVPWIPNLSSYSILRSSRPSDTFESIVPNKFRQSGFKGILDCVKEKIDNPEDTRSNFYSRLDTINTFKAARNYAITREPTEGNTNSHVLSCINLRKSYNRYNAVMNFGNVGFQDISMSAILNQKVVDMGCTNLILSQDFSQLCAGFNEILESLSDEKLFILNQVIKESVENSKGDVKTRGSNLTTRNLRKHQRSLIEKNSSSGEDECTEEKPGPSSS